MVSPLASIVAGAQQQPLPDIGDMFRRQAITNSQLKTDELQRQGMQQDMSANTRANSEAEAVSKAKYINALGKQLLAVNEEMWPRIIEPNLPQLRSLGYTPEILQGMTREQVQGAVAQTEPFVGGGGSGTAEIQNIEAKAKALVGAENPNTKKPYTLEEAKQAIIMLGEGIVPRAGISAQERIALDPDLTEAVAESSSVIKQREKFAEMTGASRANQIDSGYKQIGLIDTGLKNIDDAISAIDEGARSGAIESRFFPSIRAASVKLDQLQNKFALDVISGVTLGAISEAELRLAKEVGLPTNLPEKDLKQYLLDKKASQEKLRAYFEEQIEFLDNGGTIAGFLRSKKRGGQSADAAAPSVSSGTAAPPQVIRFDANGNLMP